MLPHHTAAVVTFLFSVCAARNGHMDGKCGDDQVWSEEEGFLTYRSHGQVCSTDAQCSVLDPLAECDRNSSVCTCRQHYLYYFLTDSCLPANVTRELSVRTTDLQGVYHLFTVLRIIGGLVAVLLGICFVAYKLKARQKRVRERQMNTEELGTHPTTEDDGRGPDDDLDLLDGFSEDLPPVDVQMSDLVGPHTANTFPSGPQPSSAFPPTLPTYEEVCPLPSYEEATKGSSK